jgi:4'-phosphopantetheinyl transferase
MQCCRLACNIYDGIDWKNTNADDTKTSHRSNSHDSRSSSMTLFRQLLTFVCEKEQKRIMRFRFEIDAKRALIGRLLIRHAICLLFPHVPFTQIALGRTERNRPFWILSPEQRQLWQVPRTFDVNISHHGDWVIVVADTRFHVGCDVTTVELPRGAGTIDEFFYLMRRTFGPIEWSLIRGIDNVSTHDQQLVQFYTHWSLKESYLKATGTGLCEHLDAIQFDVVQECSNDNEKRSLCGTLPKMKLVAREENIVEEQQREWCFSTGRLGDEHLVAVCKEKNDDEEDEDDDDDDDDEAEFEVVQFEWRYECGTTTNEAQECASTSKKVPAFVVASS